MFIYLFIFCPVAFPSPPTGPDPAPPWAGSGPVGGQNQAPPWAWFWCRFLPVKREILLPVARSSFLAEVNCVLFSMKSQLMFPCFNVFKMKTQQ